MGNNTTSKIINSLNEAMTVPVIENERTVGTDAPVQVHQCEDCACFYTVTEKTNESVCPNCGGTGEPYAEITPLTEGIEDDDDLEKDPDELTESEEDEIRSEAEVVVSEALHALDRSDFRKFNESYRPRTRMTTKGELEVIMESRAGRAITVARKMTSRQKAAYALAENYTAKTKSSKKSAKNEAIKLRRQELVMRNESRAVKVCAGRVLERMGVKYNHAKFNEQLNEFINGRNYTKMLEDISADNEIGKSELDKMTPEEIGDNVNTVIEDTGLEVVNNTVDIDGDAATVTVRVEDSPELEVHAEEIGDVLSDVFDAPVEVVGPTETDGDSTLADLAIVINSDDTVNEDDDLEDDELLDEDDEEMMSSEKKKMSSEKKFESRKMAPRGKRRHLREEDDLDAEDDMIDPEDEEPIDEDDEIMSSEKKMSSEKNESIRRRRNRRRVNEKFTTGSGDTPLFALKAIDCAVDDPCFLAQDDSMVSGNEDNAEDLARVFVSQEAAENFLNTAGIADKFEPVSITIVTNECDDLDDRDPLNEDDEEEIIRRSSEMDEIKESMRRRKKNRRR